jgi:hypothetical protein
VQGGKLLSVFGHDVPHALFGAALGEKMVALPSTGQLQKPENKHWAPPVLLHHSFSSVWVQQRMFGVSHLVLCLIWSSFG